eukprot:TRINITY_DN676_c0_g1_i1.p1 TRINITY_DN676_c0_g1~~TRINITY_DN676_c0_g1_i1.p1  ORF type:complete len:128 (-),score=12.27 TRINITY_DN676_c0_g1_i1:471-854(-)
MVLNVHLGEIATCDQLFANNNNINTSWCGKLIIPIFSIIAFPMRQHLFPNYTSFLQHRKLVNLGKDQHHHTGFKRIWLLLLHEMVKNNFNFLFSWILSSKIKNLNILHDIQYYFRFNTIISKYMKRL